MGKTIVEKILGAHAGREVKKGDIVDVVIDVRAARDFGGANVVKNIRDSGLSVADPKKTFFTFDCNPGGSDQSYATNQQICRAFARANGIGIFDIDQGIGTHVAIDRGLVVPGDTFVSTDSHANILGAVGAFGQGMGDQDIAYAFAHGRVWFNVPPTLKVNLSGKPSQQATAKDVTLALLKKFGANGLLGYAVEFYGPVVDRLGLDGRITLASMATEMGGIISLIPPTGAILAYCGVKSGRNVKGIFADGDAEYEGVEELNLDNLQPLVSRPGHPEDVVNAAEVAGRKIDSVFIGSCTNGRMEDLEATADILKGRRVAPGVVLKIVPATDEIWKEALEKGLWDLFKKAGVLVGNAGCAGCAAGQIGQNGRGEVTVSTGNRNFTGKQGMGEVYLASPRVAAASAVAGVIALPDAIPSRPVVFERRPAANATKKTAKGGETVEKPAVISGRVWVVPKDNIDTDMIFHNRYLALTDIREMGRHAFGNLEGWKDFPERAKPGDIVVAGKNFGCGSSRQQAVDCFSSLGIPLIIAESFGAIYERNAINAGLAIMNAALVQSKIESGQRIEVNFKTGVIRNLDTGGTLQGGPFSEVQMKIYQQGGLLAG
ncbi:MAG: 3-isopropylmalate dehydratase large subunit [Proteobacteria bacterium]|nr:3-isopropylmalate dehydratase large subunit [Pseudomonadota bacterium]MBU2228154.1 3-isopropylmalate dehydratase large subunit [Pseudomonadota bacterium]MBU2262475.1 3-isopropylmalate dehydratase large subunit [Pseudomonadota bacterium]